MNKLFEAICDVVFTLPDGSRILCQTTLNPGLLEAQGYADIDGFIDLLSDSIIPEDMFNYEFTIEPQGSIVLQGIDHLFQNGGKVSWTHLT